MRTMFTPLKIAGMEVKNRTFMAPMSLGYESQDGTVNEKMEAYWLTAFFSRNWLNFFCGTGDSRLSSHHLRLS